MEHSDRILQILSERGITTYKVAKATGVTNSMFTEWRKKPSSKIYSSNLVLIADYLGCSMDYLLGRTDNPQPYEKQNSPEAISDGKERFATSDKARVMRLIEGIPEHKLVFVVDLLENLKAYAGELIEPDEWDLKMIAEAKKENDGQGIPIEELAADLGITL